METVETVKKQATILQRGVADPLPVKAGADILKAFLDQTLKQPTAPPPALPRGQALDSFEQARTHLLASSRLFTGRARTARAAIAERAAREAGPGATVLTGCGSRCVRDALLRAAALQTRDLGCPQFKVVYATHAAAPPARDAAAVAALRAAGVFVAEVDWRMVPAALEAAGVRKVLVGASAVTHDGNVLAGAGTYLLAQLARAAGAQLVVLAELHKFVLEHTLNNAGLRDGGLRQEVLDFRSAEEPLAEPLAEPVLPVSEQVDWTVRRTPPYVRGSEADADVVWQPKELITSIITEKRKMPPNLAYQIILDRR